MANNVNLTTSKLFKKIDGGKVDKYFKERPELVKSTVCQKALTNRNFISDSIRKGRARIALWNNVCDELEVPRDYFDYVEPVPEPEKATDAIPEKSVDEGIRELLTSILLTQKKQEALLLEIANNSRAWN